MSKSKLNEYEGSLSLPEECSKYLAGGVSSNFRLGVGPSSLFFTHAAGSHIYSVDGCSYLDYVLGMGPVILGHAPPKVLQKVSECLARGQLYAGQHEAELRLAQMVSEIVPCAERVRFSSSGSEVVQAAVRLARAFTRRKKIIKFEGHYHGWFDNVFVSVHPGLDEAGPRDTPLTVAESEGQDPEAYHNTIALPWNDLGLLEAAFMADEGEIAGVIMEPIMCNTGVILPKPGYLEGVRQLCSRFGALLIFDEVITGFRVALSGAQGLLNVTPDLSVFAKAMAGGFPISCLAGKAVLMDFIGSGRVMHGGTYNGGVVPTVAAVSTIEELRSKNGAAYQQLRALGENLIEELRNIIRKSGVAVLIQGLGPVFNTAFTPAAAIDDYRDYCAADGLRLARFVDLLLENGVRISRRGTWFLSVAHTQEDVERTVEAASRALRDLVRE